MIVSTVKYNETARRDGWQVLCDSSACFTHPDLRRLYGVWRKHAKAGGIPRHADLSARQLRPFQADIVLSERRGENGAQRWQVKTMGRSFAQIAGDMSGQFLDAAIPADFLQRTQAGLDCTLEHRAPLRFVGRVLVNGMGFLNGEYLSAPLLDDAGSASLVLTAGRFSGGRSWEDVEAEARKALGAE